MPLPSHFECTLRFKRGNATASCILYYATAAEADEPTLEQMPGIADTIHAKFNGPLRAIFEPTTFFEGIDLVYLTSDVRWEASSTEDPQAGTAAAGDVLPEEDAVVIQRRTGLPGRGKHGRIFLPFVPEAFALDSALTVAALTKYKDVATAMGEAVAGVEGEVPPLFPRTPLFKLNVLQPVVACRVLDNTCSRRDRRDPKRARAVGVGLGNAG